MAELSQIENEAIGQRSRNARHHHTPARMFLGRKHMVAVIGDAVQHRGHAPSAGTPSTQIIDRDARRLDRSEHGLRFANAGPHARTHQREIKCLAPSGAETFTVDRAFGPSERAGPFDDGVHHPHRTTGIGMCAQRLTREDRQEVKPALRRVQRHGGGMGRKQPLEHRQFVRLGKVVHFNARALRAQGLQIAQKRRHADPAADQQVLARALDDREKIVGRRDRERVADAHHVMDMRRATTRLRHTAHDDLVMRAVIGGRNDRIGVVERRPADPEAQHHMRTWWSRGQHRAIRRTERDTLERRGQRFDTKHAHVKGILGPHP